MDDYRVEVVSSLMPIIFGFLIGITSIGGLIMVSVEGALGWILIFSIASVIGVWAIGASIYGIKEVRKYGWSAGMEDEE